MTHEPFRAVPIRDAAETPPYQDQAYLSAGELLEHLEFFDSREVKQQYLALVMRSCASEAAFKSMLTTMRKILGERP